MKKSRIASILLAGALFIPLSASAAQIKTFVAAFSVVPQEAAGLKESLQRLLSSRIAGDGISTVGSPAEADVVISASYTQIGKVFSLDAVAKLASGQTLATVFEQGESQDDLIPALGRMSAKLRAETVQHYPASALPAPAAQAAPAAPGFQGAKAQAVQTQQAAPAGGTVWMSQRISGAQTSIAPAGTVAGAKEFFVAEGHKLRLYRQEKTLALVAEVDIPKNEKVLAVDCTGRGADGSLRAYLTIIDDDNPSSRVYSLENGKLKPVAEKLPYLFRAVALKGGAAKIYAQQMGRTEPFYGDVYELSEADGKFTLQNPIKLPRFGNIFNFNMFSDAAGKSYFTLFSGDGYLVVYSEAGEELWRSPDKFGGSETYFQREAQGTVRNSDDNVRRYFLDQRITVTDKGEILVPQNAGFFVLGYQRSYTKYSLASLVWNGSSLEERWRTKLTPNYLADYFLAPGSGELVLLEVVQKEGVFGRGGSAIRVVKPE